MKQDFTKLSTALLNLDKKAQELDDTVKNVRIEIQNVLWDLIELKKEQEKKVR